MGTQQTYGDGWGSIKGDINNLKATDDGTPLIAKLDNSKPKDGWFRRYWPEGNLRYEWEYLNGQRADGISKGWWPNGNLKQTVEYKEGKWNGLKIGWYESGKIKSEVTYKNNRFDGLWHYWHENGQKSQELLHNMGKRVCTRKWDEDGELIESKGDYSIIKKEKGKYVITGKSDKENFSWEIASGAPIQIKGLSDGTQSLAIASTFMMYPFEKDPFILETDGQGNIIIR
jgi:antitoxin component YwqK of YwqJK toxin-antitoxin module